MKILGLKRILCPNRNFVFEKKFASEKNLRLKKFTNYFFKVNNKLILIVLINENNIHILI